MKISILEPYWEGVGHPRAWLRFVTEILAGAGHHVTVFCPCQDPQESSAFHPSCQLVYIEDYQKCAARNKSHVSDSLTTANVLGEYLSTMQCFHAASGNKIDLVIFNYIDNLLPKISFFARRELESAGVPWMGFWDWIVDESDNGKSWYHKLVHRPWRVFRAKTFRAVFYKAENYATFLAKVTGHRAVWVPDFCLDTSVDRNSELGTKISRIAAGRPVVLISGIIDPRKGIEEFLQLAESANDKLSVFFAIVGRVIYSQLSISSRAKLHALASAPNSNLFLHDKRVDSEGEFNDVVRRAAIVFIKYKNFQHSSGIFSKACYFHKPVLTTRGSLLGDRTLRYGVGVAAHTDSIDQLLANCAELLAAQADGRYFSGFEKYNSDNSLSNFRHVLLQTVDSFAATEKHTPT